MSSDTSTDVRNFMDPELSDVCLVVGGIEYNVHKMVLANSSKYFKAMFFSNFKERDQKRIKMKVDVGAKHFGLLMDLIYDRSLDDNSFLKCQANARNPSYEFWEKATALWTLCDQFDVPFGKKYLEEKFYRYTCPPEKGNYVPIDGGRSAPAAVACHSCIDHYIFACLNDVKLRNKDAPIDNDAFQEWLRYFSKYIPSSVPMHVGGEVVQNIIRNLVHIQEEEEDYEDEEEEEDSDEEEL